MEGSVGFTDISAIFPGWLIVGKRRRVANFSQNIYHVTMKGSNQNPYKAKIYASYEYGTLPCTYIAMYAHV